MRDYTRAEAPPTVILRLCSPPEDLREGLVHSVCVCVCSFLPPRIYECNKRCKCCSQMCTNRLVQHGLQVRLQLFKTQNKGWGIRCLDDVAKGSFVCIYAGESRTSRQSHQIINRRTVNYPPPIPSYLSSR